ncbi:MAG: hypothetical protein NWE92_06845 [Candidatus Bathyarchaeota archaeon]|nr:hypothetical protein [Candidatus Bathyarchaeota archaeon]
MSKVKIALTVLTILIAIGPVACMAFVYRDNLLGMVLPPELNNIAEEGIVGNITASDFEPPTISSPPKYDPDTGEFNVDFNFTNPLSTPISVDSFSADLKSSGSNLDLGNIELAGPINIAPGENGIIDLAGTLSQETINRLQEQYGSNGRINVVVENVDAIVAGVHFHLDSLDLGALDLSSLQMPSGGS